MRNKIKQPNNKKLVQRDNPLFNNRVPFRILSLGNASMTVEAALILPVFMLAMLSVVYLGFMIQCQDEVQWALTKTAREISAEYGATQNKALGNIAYCQTKMAKNLGKNILTFNMMESSILKDRDEIDLIINYRMKTPFRLIPLHECRFRQRVNMRAFVGVESREEKEKEEDVKVFVTPTGHVYHRNKNCTYLKLTISKMKFYDIDSIRNEGGGKYKPCERCAKNMSMSGETEIWITNYGDRYHTTRVCSAIKREVKTISLSQTGNRTPCSKCGNEEEKK